MHHVINYSDNGNSDFKIIHSLNIYKLFLLSVKYRHWFTFECLRKWNITLYGPQTVLIRFI